MTVLSTSTAPLPAESSATAAARHDVADIFCDLDGTLISTDSLHESSLLFLRKNPLGLFRLLAWAAAGPCTLKQKLAEQVIPDPAMLPYRPEVLDYLRQEKAARRRLILATAAHARIAQAVAGHLGIFDQVIATTGQENLKGARKLAAIQAAAAGRPFAYIGDSSADIPIWRAAAQACIVGNASLAARAGASPAIIFKTSLALRPLIRAFRPTQWIKNLLLFVPLLASHKLTEPGGLHLGILALLAFVAFSLCASSVYLLNDLMDIESDRRHARKKLRPFASGSLSIPAGIILSGLTAAAALALSLVTMPRDFTLLLVLYLVLTAAYSMFFKRRLLQDVFLLAGLYTLRVIAGGAACTVPISFWLAAFSMFLFLSLAFIKRYAELLIVQDRDERHASGRGYVTDDLALIESVGPSSGYMAVLVFCLYINSDMVRSLYARPEILWGLCPILLYWVTRMWFLARRRTLSDDPVVFAATDRVSLVLAVVSAVVVWFASRPHP